MSYPGGKGRTYQHIINHLPPHEVYIAAFLGEDAVMRKKRPAVVNIGIDPDPDVIARWRTADTANPGDTAVTPEMVVNPSESQRPLPPEMMIAAAAPTTTNGEATRYEFIQGDALDVLPLLLTDIRGRILLYLDPPYLRSTRSTHKDIYRHEFHTIEQHTHLLTLIQTLPHMIAISGYYSELYMDMLKGWHHIHYTTYTRSHRQVEEYLWMNYPKPYLLHDYQHLGQNYRERERIKKKKTRHLNRLQSMDDAERYAILSAFQDAGLLP